MIFASDSLIAAVKVTRAGVAPTGGRLTTPGASLPSGLSDTIAGSDEVQVICIPSTAVGSVMLPLTSSALGMIILSRTFWATGSPGSLTEAIYNPRIRTG